MMSTPSDGLEKIRFFFLFFFAVTFSPDNNNRSRQIDSVPE